MCIRDRLIIGCFLMAIGNIVQILPGNTFPWDTLFGLAFAILFIRSLYKRRMFNTTPVISSSILMLVSSALCVGVAALFFEKIVSLFKKIEMCIRDSHRCDNRCPPDSNRATSPNIFSSTALNAYNLFISVLPPIYARDDANGS